jgi:hypothetical protein
MDLVRRKLLDSLTWAALASLAAQSRLPAAEPATPAFSASIRKTITALSETIVPRTTTPGAIDVGVPGYIEFVFRRALDASARTEFLAGAAAFQADAERVLGGDFPAAPADAQLRYVAALDAECFSAKPTIRPEILGFVLTIKRLTVVGYYTSDRGARGELDVEPMPGAFRGDVRSAAATRTYYEDSFGVPLERPRGYLSNS